MRGEEGLCGGRDFVCYFSPGLGDKKKIFFFFFAPLPARSARFYSVGPWLQMWIGDPLSLQ